MSEDVMLRYKARSLIRAGKLPMQRPDRIWGGAGFGGCQCALCGLAIKQAEVAFEVEFMRDEDASAASVHLHTRCFLAMEVELLKLESERGITAKGDAGSKGYAQPRTDGADASGSALL